MSEFIRKHHVLLQKVAKRIEGWQGSKVRGLAHLRETYRGLPARFLHQAAHFEAAALRSLGARSGL